MCSSGRRIPLWIKIAYTTFMAVLVPIYLKNYGATNFLYLCDVALFTTLLGIWLESPVILSRRSSASLLHVVGGRFPFRWCSRRLDRLHVPTALVSAISVVFPLLASVLPRLRGVVRWLRQARLSLWTGITWLVLTVCYVYMPPTSPEKDPVTVAQLRDPDLPLNINYVFNLASDDEPQTWMDPDSYFTLFMAALVLGIYLPTHLMCQRWMPGPRNQESGGRRQDPGVRDQESRATGQETGGRSEETGMDALTADR